MKSVEETFADEWLVKFKFANHELSVILPQMCGKFIFELLSQTKPKLNQRTDLQLQIKT